jgi:hypothetical protein
LLRNASDNQAAVSAELQASEREYADLRAQTVAAQNEVHGALKTLRDLTEQLQLVDIELNTAKGKQ